MRSDNPLYKEALLEHYKSPKNHRKEPFEPGYLTARGRNPRCGDDVEVGLLVESDQIVSVGFRGRGCSICMASTSMLTDAVANLSPEEAVELHARVVCWFEDRGELPSKLAPLDAIKSSPSRKRCAMLGWNALGELLSKS